MCLFQHDIESNPPEEKDRVEKKKAPRRSTAGPRLSNGARSSGFALFAR
jgi:hypothetical protein